MYKCITKTSRKGVYSKDQTIVQEKKIVDLKLLFSSIIKNILFSRVKYILFCVSLTRLTKKIYNRQI